MGEETAGDWRRLNNEELHNLYASPNIIGVIRLRRIKWAGNIARVGDTRNAHKILVGKSEKRNHSEDLGIDGKIILEWLSLDRVGRCGLDACGLG
jgi:hypothetical protein